MPKKLFVKQNEPLCAGRSKTLHITSVCTNMKGHLLNIVLFLSLFTASCSNEQNNEKSVPVNETTPLTDSTLSNVDEKTSELFLLSDKIIGEWFIEPNIPWVKHTCSPDCEHINFQSNAKAIITFPDKTSENYNWSIEADTLTLEITTQKQVPYFGHFKYKIAFSENSNFTRLTLIATRNWSYDLTLSE